MHPPMHASQSHKKKMERRDNDERALLEEVQQQAATIRALRSRNTLLTEQHCRQAHEIKLLQGRQKQQEGVDSLSSSSSSSSSSGSAEPDSESAQRLKSLPRRRVNLPDKTTKRQGQGENVEQQNRWCHLCQQHRSIVPSAPRRPPPRRRPPPTLSRDGSSARY